MEINLMEKLGLQIREFGVHGRRVNILLQTTLTINLFLPAFLLSVPDSMLTRLVFKLF
jgi:hypothetical protein